MKSKTTYKCQNCAFESGKWYGRCPNCQAWNTLVEIAASETPKINQKTLITSEYLKPQSLDQILVQLKDQKGPRLYPFSSDVLNDFWNHGLTVGSLTLLAGEPGLGKSTLALQLLRSLYQGSQGNIQLLYITAEESVFELARRSERLKIPKEIMVLQSNNFEQIEKNVLDFKPNVVVIDSIQTVFSNDLESTPGSVAQVSNLASAFLALTKSRDLATILIGHVTKEGQIAGPKALEHLVDSVLVLENSQIPQYRTLTFSKHRFGSTDKQVLLKIESDGLTIITDPSLALLENLESGVGVVYGIAMDKNLPMVVEVQALVSPPGQGMFGRREALGVKVSKINTILAIAEKYLKIDLKNNDVYVQINGLPKSTYDDSLDLPILLAIVSSTQQLPVAEMSSKIKSKKTRSNLVYAGRLTLSGNLRPATQDSVRSSVASKLGFSYNPGLSSGRLIQVMTEFA